jgi:sarcosine oxidase
VGLADWYPAVAEPMHYDVIVTGVGAMGSAATCHLAARGLRVLALERFSLAHEMGSSHGLTRIIRLAYFEHPAYVPLLRRAFELWRRLQEEAGEPLLHVTGALDVGWEGSEVFEGSRRSCLEHGLAHEVLDARALATRLPAWRVPTHTVAVFQPDGGFLEPERAILAYGGHAGALGADLRTHERVLEWQVAGGTVRVRTDKGAYEGGQLVLTAGAWMGSLATALSSCLAPERQVLGWFDTAEPDLFGPERFPVFVLDAEEGRFYGFPRFGVPGFKIGKYHHRGERIDPDAMDRVCRAEDEAVLRAAVSRYFPTANGRLLRSAACMFTNTPDGHFIIDRDPSSPEVLLVSPCSGHGFKFASVIGEIVADLVARGATAHDISLFRLGRFSAGVVSC